MKTIPSLSELLNSRKYRPQLAGAAILMGAIAACVPQLFAGTFVYTGGTVTENFDNLGTGGLTTTSLSGTGSLPNDGTSPWFIGITPTTTGNTAALVTTTAIESVSNGSVAVAAGPPSLRLFNNGSTGATDRALGTANTGGDPVIDLALKNGTLGSMTAISLSYDTEFWRGGVGAAASFGYKLLFSTNGTTWTDTAATQASLTFASAAVLDGNAAANRQATTLNYTLPTVIGVGGTFFLRWWDTNDPTNTPDANIALDNFTFSATIVGGPGANLIYNLAHTVGGAPDGVLQVSTAKYFLNGATQVGFAANDQIAFSQAGTATIDVPADVAPFSTTVSAASGTYTIGGAGKIGGTLTKTNGSKLVLTSANNFSLRTITGGTVESQADGALGTGATTLSGGALLNTINAAQALGGGITIGVGGATIQTDTNLSAGGLSGTGALVKTGFAALSLAGVAGTATGGLTIKGGTLQADSAGVLGAGGSTLATAQSITLDSAQSFPFGATLDFNQASGGVTFNDPNVARTLNLTANGGTVSVAAIGAEVLFSRTNSIFSPNGVTPILNVGGFGAVRMNASQNMLAADWQVNGGTLEAATGTTNALGSGNITVNDGGRLAGGGANTIANNVVLSGGDLATRTADGTIFSGLVSVVANSRVALQSYSTPANSLSLTISGRLTGSSELLVRGNNPQTATSSLNLTNATNSFSGIFRIDPAQILSSQSSTGVGTTLGAADVILAGGAGTTANPAVLRIRDNGTASNGVLVYNTDITANTGDVNIDIDHATNANVGNTVQFGRLRIDVSSPLLVTDTVNETVNFLAGSNYKALFTGPVAINGDLTGNPNGTAVVNVPTAVTFQGAISGNFPLRKDGGGRLGINAVGTDTALTTISAGSLGGSGGVGGALLVNPGATFAPGQIRVGGVPSPGDGPGIFSVANNFTLSTASSVLSMELSHGVGATPVAGTDYDQVIVGTGSGSISTGAVNLPGGTLNGNLTLTIGTGILMNDLFFLIINDGNDPITGTFGGTGVSRKLEGDEFVVSSQRFRITYLADSVAGTFTGGNDVALKAVPEPTTGMLALSVGAGLLGLRRRRS